MNQLLHTPEGVRDIFGQECDKKRYLRKKIDRLFRSFGYQSIETPSLEFFDVFCKEVGTTPSRDLYKFFDRDGNTLVLRPDFTPSIARAAAVYFQKEDMPLRFCYEGNVFTNSHSYQGRLHESNQIGIEYLNDNSAEADAEVIALTSEVMGKAGINEYLISLSDVGFFNALVEEAGLVKETVDELKELLSIKNRFGLEELIESLNLRKDLKEALCAVPDLVGGPEILTKAKLLTRQVNALSAIRRLEEIYEILRLYGCEKYVTFDLGMVSSYSYYTGILFQVFTYGTGDALIKGGRYDKLLKYFGKDAQAVGFTTDVDAILSAIQRQNLSLPIGDIKTMMLYPKRLEKMVIAAAKEHRAEGMDVACVRFEYGKTLEGYKEYGKRNQFGGIIYFVSETEVFAIDLGTNETRPVDFSRFLL